MRFYEITSLSVCIPNAYKPEETCLHVPALSLLCNVSKNTFSRQRIHTNNRRTAGTRCVLWGPCRMRYSVFSAMEVGDQSQCDLDFDQSQDSQSRETVRYGHKYCGTLNREWLYWRGSVAIYPTDRLLFLTTSCLIQIYEYYKIKKFIFNNETIWGMQ
jgi:hypothetical protein